MLPDPALLLLADGRLPTGAHAHSFGLESAVGRGLVGDLADLEAWMVGCLHTTWATEAGATLLATRLAASVVDSAPMSGPSPQPAGPGGGSARRGQVVGSAPVSGPSPQPAGSGGGSAPHAGARSQPAVGPLRRLDAEVAARQLSAHARTVARTLGRQLLRTGRTVWPHPALDTVATLHPDGPTQPVALGAVVAAAGQAPATGAQLGLHHALQSAATAAVRLLGLDPFRVARLVASLGPAAAEVARDLQALPDDPAALPVASAATLDVLLTHHATADGRLFAS